MRFLVAVGLGTAAFNMQDIILEPYGGEILHLLGRRDDDAHRADRDRRAGRLRARRALARPGRRSRTASPAFGALAGVLAFSAVIFAEPLQSPLLFRVGAALIGFGGGLFSVGTLTAAMSLESGGLIGLALGAWGAVQATSAGIAIGLGGAIRDAVSARRRARRARPGARQRRDRLQLRLSPRDRTCCSRRWSRSVRWFAAPTRLRGPARPFGLAEFPG